MAAATAQRMTAEDLAASIIARLLARAATEGWSLAKLDTAYLLKGGMTSKQTDYLFSLAERDGHVLPTTRFGKAEATGLNWTATRMRNGSGMIEAYVKPEDLADALLNEYESPNRKGR